MAVNNAYLYNMDNIIEGELPDDSAVKPGEIFILVPKNAGTIRIDTLIRYGYAVQIYAQHNDAISIDSYNKYIHLDDVITSKENVLIKFSAYNGITDLSNAFYGGSYLLAIKANIHGVQNIEYMFTLCTSLTTVTLLNNAAVLMNNIFSSCTNLTNINISDWDTSKVTDMTRMFVKCTKLTSLDLSSFDTSNVTNMCQMFSECAMESLNISTWDTSKVTDMSRMFYECKKLTSLDLSNFNTSSVTNMRQMFYRCNSLTSLDLSSLDTSNVTDMYQMFDTCTNLTNIVFGSNFLNTSLNINNLNDSSNTSLNMFYNCPANKPYWDIINHGWTSNGTYCTAITLIPGPEFGVLLNAGGFTFGKYMYANVSESILNNPNTKSIAPSGNVRDACMWYDTMNNIIYWWANSPIVYLNPDSSYMFKYPDSVISYLRTIDFTGLDTSKVTNAEGMFKQCTVLNEFINISNFNTSNITNMKYMFYGCSGFLTLDLSSFDTSNVTDMSYMFAEMSELRNLDIHTFNTSNLINAEHMFENCIYLLLLDVSSWNIQKLTNMKYMFNDCLSLDITYGSAFVPSNTILNTTYTEVESNPTYYAYSDCKSAKPSWVPSTPHEWSQKGTWVKV